jgi:hypothetical protein
MLTITDEKPTEYENSVSNITVSQKVPGMVALHCNW